MDTPVDYIMLRASLAGAEFTQFTQEQTDAIVRAAAEAGFAHRVSLAKLAYEETGIGKWEDKVMKNVVATQFVYNDIRDLKTVGIISEDKESGISEIAQPMGPVLAIIPVTNPTSTTLFKILIALKSRNPIIICPPRKAIFACAETAKICYNAVLKAGAPEDCIQWLSEVSREQTQELMRHKKVSLILATGGGGLVNAAYSSGTPTLGVGAGNVPVFIEKSADVPFAVEQIVMSKTFDNGTTCASEQSIIVEKVSAEQVKAEFIKHRAYFVPEADIPRLEAVALDQNSHLMNPDIVGKPATMIAKRAGLTVPEDTTLLIAPLHGIGKEFPLSSEILAPILAFYVVDDFDAAIKCCIELNYFGGIGHTASLFTNDENVVKKFALLMNAGRICVNTPSSQGAVGALFNKLDVSLTLGCGTGGKNITTDNVSAKHLLNIQRIARRRVNDRFVNFDQKKYYDDQIDLAAVEKEFNKNH
jgi:acetaldehyde dehydrogenase/alcohol dehydrogenase